ncbi:MAG: hypothetical protein KBG85_00185 [Micropruina sp.]|jgi:hypothetical protein|nr:hypothetical protein [Micropruina sp.]
MATTINNQPSRSPVTSRTSNYLVGNGHRRTTSPSAPISSQGGHHE